MTRIIGHIFVDDDGNLTVTPTMRVSPEDLARLQSIWRHKLISSDDRLAAARK